jgi:potassium-dependent mechanosensitive channel
MLVVCQRMVWIITFMSLAFTANALQMGQQRFEYLVQQKNDFTYLINQESKMLTTLSSSDEIQKKITKNEENQLILQGKISSLQSQLDNQKSQQVRLSEQLKMLQKSSSRFSMNHETEEKQQQIKTAYILGKKTQDLLEASLNLAYRYQTILTEHHHQLKLLLAKAKHLQELKRIMDEKERLNSALDKLYAAGVTLQQRARYQVDTNTSSVYEQKILLNGQAIDLIQSKLTLLELNTNWVDAEYKLQRNPNMSSLESITDTYRAGIIALTNQEALLKKQHSVLMAEADRFDSTDLKKQWIALINTVNSLLKEVTIQEQTLQEDIEGHQVELSKQLATRAKLPDLSPESWPHIFKQLFQIPIELYSYLKNLGARVYDNYVWQEWPFKMLLWGSVFIIGLATYFLRIFIKKNISSAAPPRLTGKVYRGTLILILRNLPYLFMLFLLWMIFYLNDVSYSNYELLFSLLTVFIFFNALQLMSRLIFLDKHSYISEHDLHLYHQINRLLIVGVTSTLLVVFSHQYPLSMFIQELFNRLFMFFLLVVAIAIWRSKEVINQFVSPLVENKKRYFKNLTFLLLVLIPITLLTTAVIGLMGYQNLAWSLSRYQAQFLILIAIYVLVRGVLIDVLELISEWMIASLYNGWLWIEVVLKPLDNIIRIVLFLGLLFALCKLIDSYSSFSIINQLRLVSSYVLISSPGIYITVSSVIKFIALVAVFFWLSKWTREFCYRWLYRHARDVGIRNSFSVFTQYTVITIGFFITVRVLGFDFTGLSLILGGLAVGMGFGLRDFASNIVGGLMLLIERPVREGDLVTIGDYEGRVAHIGIRSMRVSSWDNMEVLIPNAETFNKPFTNWTHQDSIVRTVIPIKVSRADDPLLVQQLLLEVLAQTPEILSVPPAQAFLTQIDEALITFELRYFINVNLHTRFEVRSKILFIITAKFKEAGIKAPIPPLQVELSNQDKCEVKEPRSEK